MVRGARCGVGAVAGVELALPGGFGGAIFFDWKAGSALEKKGPQKRKGGAR
jgi:hypothetical protein